MSSIRNNSPQLGKSHEKIKYILNVYTTVSTNFS